MSAQDPRRLLDAQDGVPGLKSLLESAAADAPTPAQLASLSAKLAATLGVAAVGAAASTAAAASTGTAAAGTGGAAAGSTAAGAAAGATGAAVSVGAKVVLVVAAAGLAGGSFVAGRRFEAKQQQTRAVARSLDSARDERSAPAPVAPSPAPVAPSPEPSLDSARDERTVPAAPVVPEPPHPARRPAPEPTPEAEVALLEEGYAAARAQDYAKALALVARHERAYGNGLLVQEREVLAVEALQKLGRTAEARARAERFFARFPSSTHRLKVQALIDGP